MASNVIIVDHPLVAHKLSLLRDKTTTSMQFRQLMREASLLIGYEVLRDLPTEQRLIETPVAPMQAPFLKGKKVVVVPILRAGTGFIDGLLDLVPSARVGHIGIYRDPETLAANEYYFKMPEDLTDRLVIVCDPMLATGNSAIAAVARLKEALFFLSSCERKFENGIVNGQGTTGWNQKRQGCRIGTMSEVTNGNRTETQEREMEVGWRT